MLACFGGRQANGAAKGFERHAPARTKESRGQRGGIILPNVECGILELIGQQTKAWNVCRPAPAGGTEFQKSDLDGIARFGTIDINRTCHRIDLAEIQRVQISNG
jgi:hypothetical protein